MPIVSAVVHATPQAASTVHHALCKIPHLEVGLLYDGRIPVVADTETRDDDRAVWRAVDRIDGVAFVELAHADFSDVHGVHHVH